MRGLSSILVVGNQLKRQTICISELRFSWWGQNPDLGVPTPSPPVPEAERRPSNSPVLTR